MKVAAYIRVSTHEQVMEGYSINAQKTKLQAYAVSQGWEIVSFYVDEGISAKDMNRPELQRMLKGVREKIFECVLVYRLDRLTRSVLDLHELINIFEKYDVKFKSATEVFDTTTAMGRLFITIVGAMASWERENLGERVKFGLEQKAKEGKWAINIPPFGYDKNGDYLKINEVEAVVVREIFSMYLSGEYGMKKIAAELNKRGLKTKAGKPFNDPQIKYILTNPTYTGTMRYNYRVNKENYFEIAGAVPAIIDEDTFQKVQLLSKRRSTNHGRRATSPHIFSGVARCGKCGRKLNGKYSNAPSKNGKVYESYQYYCKNKAVGLCDAPIIAQNFLESRFLELISTFDFSQGADEVAAEQEGNASDDVREKEIKRELKAIENRKTKWQYGWANEMMTDEQFQARMKEENEKEKMLLKELEAFGEKEIYDTSTIKETLIDVKRNWEHWELHEKKQFVQMLVQDMVVEKVSNVRKPESVVIKDIKFY